jgi:dipeptide/tripeptide permease
VSKRCAVNPPRVQGPLLSIVSGLAPAHVRGTAFGIFYTAMAVTAVVANTMYGTLWHTYGANAAFTTSAGLMMVLLAALPHLLPPSARRVLSPAPAVAGLQQGPASVLPAAA